VALADPDLPPGVTVPELSQTSPAGLNADRYGSLREAFHGLPRRSRVIIVLRLSIPGRQPLTLRAIARLFGVTLERIRQLEHHAIWTLAGAWLPQGMKGLTRDERVAQIAPVIAAAIDRYPIGDRDPVDGQP
jgi:hypothetical protein